MIDTDTERHFEASLTTSTTLKITTSETMPTLRISYPIIRFHTINVALSDKEMVDVQNMSLEEQAEFIETQHQRLDIDEMIMSRRDIASALDMNYATIKQV
ncbi:hypothetical protein [uncultured Fibrella sp.]|uniref:hypothetical protein n=1 Tax=uncultured Fibrella sp. TaxID=1284596 RepID=UPI0035CAB27C